LVVMLILGAPAVSSNSSRLSALVRSMRMLLVWAGSCASFVVPFHAAPTM